MEIWTSIVPWPLGHIICWGRLCDTIGRNGWSAPFSCSNNLCLTWSSDIVRAERLLKTDSVNILWIWGAQHYSADIFALEAGLRPNIWNPLMSEWVYMKTIRGRARIISRHSFTVVIYARHVWVFVFIVGRLAFCVKKEVGRGSSRGYKDSRLRHDHALQV